jgi:hypothetical protein
MKHRNFPWFIRAALGLSLPVALAAAMAQTPSLLGTPNSLSTTGARTKIPKGVTITCPNMIRAQWMDVDGWGIEVPQAWFLSARVVDPATGWAIIECTYSMNASGGDRPRLYWANRTIGAGIKASSCRVQGATATCVQ